MQNVGFASFATSSLYPLSVLLYNIEYHVFHALFGYDLARTFIFTLSLNLFLTALLVGLLAQKLFYDYKISLLAAFLVATSRWLVDNQRMGVMAESFGWVFFAAALYCYFGKRWFLFALSTIALFFAHPMPFGVLMVYLVVMTAYGLISAGKKDKLILLFSSLVGLIVLYLLYRYDPFGIFSKALSIASMNMDAGSRTFWGYLTDSETRRFSIYFLSFIGVVLLLLKKERKYNFIVIMYFIGLLVTFKDWFGIHYLSYRFYFYYELSVALVAAYGLVTMLKIAFNNYAILLLAPLAYLLIQPQWAMNQGMTKWQATDYLAGATRPKNDRQMEDEIVSLIEPGAKVYSQSHWAEWLTLRGVNVVHQSYKGLYQKYEYPDLGSLKDSGFRYLYFSSIEPFNQDIDNDKLINLIIDKDGVRLYEFKQTKTSDDSDY